MSIFNGIQASNGDVNGKLKLVPSETTPCSDLSRYKIFLSTDQEKWWSYSAHLLGKILELSRYPIDQQYKYLSLYQNLFIPTLGPYPHRWHASITYSGIPIEFSVNYQRNGQETVRVGFEPASYDSGTKRDLYNQITVRDAMNRIASLKPKGFSDQLFHHFMTYLSLSSGEVEHLNGAKIEGTPFKTQAALGLDFKGGEFVTKTYIYPALKSKVTGRSLPDLLASSVDRMGDEMKCSETLALVNEYMVSGQCYNQYSFMGFDCISPTKSRLKVYGALIGISLEKAEEIWLLGGRVTSPDNQEGLALFRTFWKCLTKDKEERPVGIWNYELSPGSLEPAPKFYFDLHGENDYENAEGITKFFQHLGWNEKADRFVDTVHANFPKLDLKNTNQIIQYVSFAYTARSGPYISVYYHSASTFPRIQKQEDTL